MCAHFGVTRAGFYAWHNRQPSARQLEDSILIDKVRASHLASHKIYGAPRVMNSLRQQGICLGQRRVARLMRMAHIQGRSARIYRHSRTGSKAFFNRNPNRCDKLVPSRIDQLWVGDVTYLKVRQQWRYLAVVMDRFSRRILGWSLSACRDTALTATAFELAIRRRQPQDPLIFHSDRGIEYAAHHYGAVMLRRGIDQSMNRPSKMNDNAHMESFFHSLKSEFLFGKTFDTEDDLRLVIKQYMHFYNQQRLHSALGYLCPVQFEITQSSQPCVN
jgi:putative transposase